MRKDSSLALVLGAIVVSGCSTTAGEPTNFNPSLDDSQDAASAPQDSGPAPSATPDGGTGTPGQGPGNPDNTPDAAVDDATTSTKDASEADTSTASADDDAGSTGAGETGRLVGMTAAHNAVRAMVKTTPALPPLTWSPTLAAYAQQWATSLASSASTCAAPQHRPSSELKMMDYGENLATFGGESFGGMSTGDVSTAAQAVNAWAGEVACWTYGTIEGTEVCNMTCSTNLHSDGCGHYTQIVWRKSLELGCGVATCKNGAVTEDIWICNYAPAGNIVGEAPY
jgi:pathogenesis-related protein 1